MRSAAVLGNSNIRFERGSATSASNCVAWDAEQEHRVLTRAVAGVAPELVTKQGAAFEAVRHEYRITNQAVVVRESDSDLKPITNASTNERFHSSHGRLLTFRKFGK